MTNSFHSWAWGVGNDWPPVNHHYLYSTNSAFTKSGCAQSKGGIALIMGSKLALGSSWWVMKTLFSFLFRSDEHNSAAFWHFPNWGVNPSCKPLHILLFNLSMWTKPALREGGNQLCPSFRSSKQKKITFQASTTRSTFMSGWPDKWVLLLTADKSVQSVWQIWPSICFGGDKKCILKQIMGVQQLGSSVATTA